jgi:hypothetical protein
VKRSGRPGGEGKGRGWTGRAPRPTIRAGEGPQAVSGYEPETRMPD